MTDLKMKFRALSDSHLDALLYNCTRYIREDNPKFRKRAELLIPGVTAEIVIRTSRVPTVDLGKFFAGGIECEMLSIADGKKIKTIIIEEWERRWPYLPIGSDRDRPMPGVLSASGYRVGRFAKATRVRKEILDHILSGTLPPVKDKDYMHEWGVASSAKRYRKLKRVLKSFDSQNKYSPDLELAVAQWNSDIEYVDQKWSFLAQ